MRNLLEKHASFQTCADFLTYNEVFGQSRRELSRSEEAATVQLACKRSPYDRRCGVRQFSRIW
jgi:hypothetical protein